MTCIIDWMMCQDYFHVSEELEKILFRRSICLPTLLAVDWSVLLASWWHFTTEQRLAKDKLLMQTWSKEQIMSVGNHEILLLLCVWLIIKIWLIFRMLLIYITLILLIVILVYLFGNLARWRHVFYLKSVPCSLLPCKCCVVCDNGEIM